MEKKQTLREAIEELIEVYRTESSIDAYNDLKNILEFDFPKPSGPTVRARFAIATAYALDSGRPMFHVHGDDADSDEDAASEARNGFVYDMATCVTFAEVDVPLPAPVTIEAEVLP